MSTNYKFYRGNAIASPIYEDWKFVQFSSELLRGLGEAVQYAVFPIINQ